MNDASQRQTAAADPASSTWLSANAGSGKTRVLTDRVARLLLNGVRPQNILCLTYTKAAAGEMQNRLFRRLGGWAMEPDDRLAAALAEIGAGGPVDADQLARARRLFAGAIETPGGLKIQTIHSFCAAILRQFPLEAQVSPRFREIDEREAKLMLRQVFDRLASGPGAESLARFARHMPGDDLAKTLEMVASAAQAFESGADLRRWYGLAEDCTAEQVVADALAAAAAAPIAAFCRVWSASNKTDQARADAFASLGRLPPAQQFEVLRRGFLTTEGAPRSALFSKAAATRHGALQGPLETLIGQVAAAASLLVALEECERSEALNAFGREFCAAYRAEKLRAGVLDFDDLIQRTLTLLSDPGVADWVLYKLDGGIDHILVDEAQDTSPAQWAIIERLAREFASGLGARPGVERTIFAVGDPKQSIYSFQGADPREFERMRTHFAERLTPTGRPLRRLELVHSFRSSPAILRLVDQVFATGHAPGVGGATRHVAFHPDRPGRVDLWPLTAPPEPDPLPEWWDTSDRTSPEKDVIALAARIAAEVRRMLAEEQVEDGGRLRPMRAGDVLILVRRRSYISQPLIAALKRQGLDVAGSDQIDLASDLSVMDVLAVLKFLDTPADSLSLAAALRSPLFGLSEAELYDLAHDRIGDLWDALLAQRDRHPEAVAILEDLRNRADFLRPFELIERLLIWHGGRRRLVARLGEEVGETLDLLVDQAIAFETSAVPSLTGFIAWQEVDGTVVKRQAETGADKVRVMTVHGAKGLEAPVVILPDTADYKPPNPDPITVLPDRCAVFRPNKKRMPGNMEEVLAAEAQARAEESDRLFYVALTRARSWLIVCGAGKDQNTEVPCWHRQVRDAMVQLGAQPLADGGLRLSHGQWPPPSTGQRAAPVDMPALPDWAREPAGPAPEWPKLLSPSSLGLGGPAVTGEAGEVDARSRGTMLHLLLEHLPLHPPEDWRDLAILLLSQQEEPASDTLIAEVLEEATAVLSAPDLRDLFAGESLAEVDVTAALPEAAGLRMYGRIDRLVRRGGVLMAVDFKSNRTVPDRPEDTPLHIQAQMGAYLSALRQVFPDTPVDVAVLWTRRARLMPLPHEMVTEALRRATTS